MRQLLVFVLILGISISCKKHNQDAAPSDPLYQKWKLIETKASNGSWEPVSYESLIEFRTDGSIRYPNAEPACCSPISFERQSQTLKITAIYGGGDCIHVDCISSSAYQIITLTPDELIYETVFAPNQLVGPGIIAKYKALH